MSDLFVEVVDERNRLRAELEQARTEIQIKDAQIVVISEMYDRVHTERDRYVELYKAVHALLVDRLKWGQDGNSPGRSAWSSTSGFLTHINLLIDAHDALVEIPDEATQEGERAENPNYVEGRNFDKETRDHLARASDRRRDTIDG